ncbi:regulatory protein, FmdB family [Desulfovibrio sp. X2]|uniref:FmdB family zinc ribbon protein n=1 Tax=Desulfovibrio sp. X2 TaxID=941449 RepID=UPI00035878FB|nr:zinc ribbon domain-containing protein [Desulfovibrio sp. X2]EPR40852.1 regulatory protein, FmdB family [Desulfovibrio sp. X2]
MPIFEYVCGKCGKEFEELVFGDETPPCPHCAAKDTQKLMSCCRHKNGGASGGDFAAPSAPSSGGGGCAGCSGGSCATCH